MNKAESIIYSIRNAIETDNRRFSPTFVQRNSSFRV